MAKRRAIDLGAVRTARQRLETLAKQHPELTGPKGPQNREAWRATLAEDTMANTTQYTFRLPDELVARLDAYAERLAEDTGLEVTRADAVKQLLTRGLDAADAPKKAKR